MSSISLIQPDRDLFSWPQYWAACFGPAPFLPMSRGTAKTTLCVWVNRICFSVLLLATWIR